MTNCRRATVALVRAAVAGSVAVLLGTPGCGGGGGGGGAAPAKVTGRVLQLNIGTLPAVLPGASVNVGGASATTATDGTFTIASAPSNATQLTVSGSGIQTLMQPVKLTPNATNALGDIFVLPTSDTTDSYKANIVSSVVRADNQKPIAGATVVISGQTTTTDANGNFRINGLPTGIDSSAGFVGQITPPATGANSDLSTTQIHLDLPLGAGDNPLPPFVLATGASNVPPGSPTNIRGAITLHGAPNNAGATVTLQDQNGNTVAGPVITDATGAYGFYVIAGTYTIQVSATGYTSQSATVTLTSPDTPINKNFTLVP